MTCLMILCLNFSENLDFKKSKRDEIPYLVVFYGEGTPRSSMMNQILRAQMRLLKCSQFSRKTVRNFLSNFEIHNLVVGGCQNFIAS